MDENVEAILGEVRLRESHFSGLIARSRDIRALVEGRWETVFPDDIGDADLPMVSNLFRVTVEDVGRLFAEQIPMTRVDRATERDASGAEDREKLLMAYDNLSQMWMQHEWMGQDMAAVGFTAIKTWPRRFKTKDGLQRFPVHERIDPLTVLPERAWKPHRPTDDVIVDGEDTVERLKAWFPVEIGGLLDEIIAYKLRTATMYGTTVAPSDDELLESLPQTLRVLDYYGSRRICRYVVYDDGVFAGGCKVVDLPNPTEICPVQMAYRPSWSTEPHGQVDDAKGIVRTQNRYFRLLLDYFVEMVYGGKLVWNVKNPNDRGPGVRWLALGPDAKMDNITPEVPAPIALAMMQQLEGEARSTSVAPRSREGDVQLNKASAAFLERAQGQLVSVVKSNQRQFAAAKVRSNEAAFAQDEAWCNQHKVVTGTARGQRFRMVYTPREIIRGDHSNRVQYGAREGIDQPTWQILQLQKLDAGAISRETFLEEDPSTEDVTGELARIRRQAFEDSLLQMIMEQSVDPQQKLRIIAAFQDGADVREVARLALQAAPVAPGPTPTDNGGALPGPGGPVPPQPGQAGPAPLPPLATIRNVG